MARPATGAAEDLLNRRDVLGADLRIAETDEEERLPVDSRRGGPPGRDHIFEVGPADRFVAISPPRMSLFQQSAELFSFHTDLLQLVRAPMMAVPI